MGPFWDQTGVILGCVWCDFGPFLGRSGVIFGTLKDHFGIVSASFWRRFDPILRVFWAFGPFLGHFPLSSGFFFVCGGFLGQKRLFGGGTTSVLKP